MSTLAIALIVLLPFEALVLRLAQRRLFFDIERVVRSRLVAYAVAVPSTVAHELAHAIMAVCLGVPIGKRAGGRVELFRPRRDEATGHVQLGMVSVAQTDALRSSLISIAPFALIPVMLLALNQALLGTTDPIEAVEGLGALEPWRIGLWLVLALTLPMAAFPSPGDHIGVGGAVALLAAGGLAGYLLYLRGGEELIVGVVSSFSALLLLPALVAAVLLAALAGPRAFAPRSLLHR